MNRALILYSHLSLPEVLLQIYLLRLSAVAPSGMTQDLGPL